MSRWQSRDEGSSSRSASTGPTAQGEGRRPDQGQELGRIDSAPEQNNRVRQRTPVVSTPEPRQPYRDRHRTYMLRDSEIQLLTDIGKFRVLDVKDLEQFLYRGEEEKLEIDLGNLRRQHLILERQIPQHDAQPRHLFVLTKEARHLLVATKAVPKEQALYQGFTKAREANHDADLYKLYQHGLEKARSDGANNIRVILDSELKRILYRDLARADAQGAGEERSAIAEQHGLRVVRDSIPVPDLRLEYETANGETARLDLELATEHYRFRNIARKVLAGFSIYARSQDAQNLRRVLDQKDITAEILNL
jgi:hypothetical protein